MAAVDIRQQIAFKDAMASFPSGVTVVTTMDDSGKWWGFTASSFCSLSAEPPLVLVCLANKAECHPVFTAVDRWTVHILHGGQIDIALRFATRGADKFASGVFEPDQRGLPRMEAAAAVTLECATFARHKGGDHTILIGSVERCYRGEDPPVVYSQRAFHTLNRILPPSEQTL